MIIPKILTQKQNVKVCNEKQEIHQDQTLAEQSALSPW